MKSWFLSFLVGCFWWVSCWFVLCWWLVGFCSFDCVVCWFVGVFGLFLFGAWCLSGSAVWVLIGLGWFLLGFLFSVGGGVFFFYYRLLGFFRGVGFALS